MSTGWDYEGPEFNCEKTPLSTQLPPAPRERIHNGFKLKVLRLVAGAPLPTRATKDAAGLDLCACRRRCADGSMVMIEGGFELLPGERRLIGTGIAIEIPWGWEGQVRPRSGLALKHGVTVLNSPGTIDADYRGEVGVILINLGHKPYVLKNGDRIAQLLIKPVEMWTAVQVDALDVTGRGAGGYGSTG